MTTPTSSPTPPEALPVIPPQGLCPPAFQGRPGADAHGYGDDGHG